MNFWTRFFRPESAKADLSSEIEFHLKMAAADNQARGTDSDTSHRLARKEFGNVGLVKDVTRDMSGWTVVEQVGQDLRFALRQLNRNRGFSFAVILTLALGIGVNTAVFSMVNGFMLRPLPYPGADRIANLILHTEGVSSRGQFDVEDDDSHTSDTWDLISHSLTKVQMAAQGGTTGINLQASTQSGSTTRYVHATRVSSAYFDVLGIPLFLGRSFSAEEDRAGGPRAVVLGYALWQSAFAGDRTIVGKQITLKGEPYTVVGVLPGRVLTPGHGELFTSLAPNDTNGECRGTNCSILLRLRTGATWPAAGLEIGRLRTPIFERIHNLPQGRAWFYAQPLSRYLGNQMRAPVLVLMFAVGLILFIACANLAGLTLVSIGRRTQEIATRLALGASRTRILRQLWMESLLLALMGAVAGLALAAGILASLHGFVPEEFLPLGGLSLDMRVLAFTFGASLGTSLLFGALPACRTRRVDLRSSFISGSRSVTSGASRIRQVLIAGEVSLTVVLLFSAGLLIRTLVHLETVPPGFNGKNVMTAKLSLDDVRYHDPAAFQLLIARSLEAMRRIPGVEDAAVGLSVPYERGLNEGTYMVDGPFRGQQIVSSLAWVTSEYFSTLRMPILAGRTLSASDSSLAEHVAVVNADFARTFFHDAAPIGRHMRSGKDLITVVGVVGNVAKRPGVNRDAPIATEPEYYIPAAQADPQILTMGSLWFQPSWIVRTKGPSPTLASAMQRALAQADPTLPFAGFYAMSDILADSLVFQRVQVFLLGALAALALLLSAIGIYGLVSSLVLQRTREIGIRMALGSSAGEAMIKIGKAGIAATACGIALGFVLSLASARVLHSQLYGVHDNDPLTLLGVTLGLGAVAFAASFLPTLRITRIQPAATLRME